jgi:hypothetical protein
MLSDTTSAHHPVGSPSRSISDCRKADGERGREGLKKEFDPAAGIPLIKL